MASVYSPDEYEKRAYYNGIAGGDDHPDLVYRSDFLMTPFPKPTGQHGQLPTKSVHGVFCTPLNQVWDTVGRQIRDLLRARKIDWSSINPAHFVTHTPAEEGEERSVGPVVVWIGVSPGSTTADTAHEVSGEILALLLKHGIEDVVVEWRESVVQRLDAGREGEGSQGTLTL